MAEVGEGIVNFQSQRKFLGFDFLPTRSDMKRVLKICHEKCVYISEFKAIYVQKIMKGTKRFHEGRHNSYKGSERDTPSKIFEDTFSNFAESALMTPCLLYCNFVSFCTIVC